MLLHGYCVFKWISINKDAYLIITHNYCSDVSLYLVRSVQIRWLCFLNVVIKSTGQEVDSILYSTASSHRDVHVLDVLLRHCSQVASFERGHTPLLVLPQYSCNLMLQVASTDAFRIAASCWILDSSSVQYMKPESSILSPQCSWSLNNSSSPVTKSLHVVCWIPNQLMCSISWSSPRLRCVYLFCFLCLLSIPVRIWFDFHVAFIDTPFSHRYP